MTAICRPADLYGFEGQSLNLSPSGAGNVADRHPAKVHAVFPGSLGPVTGISGASWATRSLDATNRVDRWLRRATGSSFLIDVGGTTDVLVETVAADILADAEAFWTARASAGWGFIVAATITPSTLFNGTKETLRLATNTLIRASTVPDAIADLAADPLLDDYTDTTYYSDGTHPTAAGATAIANVILAALP